MVWAPMTVFQVELSVDSPFLSLNENVADSWKQEDTPVPTFLFLFCLRQTSNKPVTAARGKKKSHYSIYSEFYQSSPLNSILSWQVVKVETASGKHDWQSVLVPPVGSTGGACVSCCRFRVPVASQRIFLSAVSRVLWRCYLCWGARHHAHSQWEIQGTG